MNNVAMRKSMFCVVKTVCFINNPLITYCLNILVEGQQATNHKANIKCSSQGFENKKDPC